MQDFSYRYEKYGWDFAHYNPLSKSTVAWITEIAKQTGSPILELACGTGRILALLAEKGYDVYGMDISEAMLAHAEKNRLELPDNTKYNMHLVYGDMTEFDLVTKFKTIYIVDHSFSELRERQQQIDALACIRKHLDDSGKFLIEAREYNPAQLKPGRMESNWMPLKADSRHKSLARKTIVMYNESTNVLHGQMLYKVVEQDGQEKIDTFNFESIVMTADDYISLLNQAGFKILSIHRETDESLMQITTSLNI